MAAMKGRILLLLKSMMDCTDYSHDMTSADIISLYEKNGYSATEKTVRDDMKSLIEAGFPIIKTDSPGKPSYYSYEQILDAPELKMISDAVAAARFISRKDCDSLIAKLRRLGGGHTTDGPFAKPGSADRIRTTNRNLYTHMDAISHAMDTGRKISYQYFDYTDGLEKTLRNSGEIYVYSPYSFEWSEDCYYLLGQLDKRPGIINPIRIDLMHNVSVLDEEALPMPDGFDPADYMRKVFMMYSGEDATVRLLVKNRLRHKIVERFGNSIAVMPAENECFMTDVCVSVSPTFYSWVFQFGGGIRILSPGWVRNGYADALSSEAKAHATPPEQ